MDDNTPIKHESEEMRPVAWTPEDASRFLSNAIHEAQKPLADALKQRPATTGVFILIVLLLVVAAGAIGWILSSQLSKSESNFAAARSDRDAALAQQYELQSKSDTLEARLAAAKEEQERLSDEYSKETATLRGQAEGKRDNEEELRKAQSDLARFRRQNELLKNQISGLEMEKLALARQLEAVRAMAIDEDFGDETDQDAVVIEEPPIPGPGTPPAAAPETPVSQAEPPTEEAPAISVPAPAVPGIAISDAETDPLGDGTLTVEEVAKETGALTLGVNGENPPTLYETSRIDANSADALQIGSTGTLPEIEAAAGETSAEELEEASAETIAEEAEMETGGEAEEAEAEEEAKE